MPLLLLAAAVAALWVPATQSARHGGESATLTYEQQQIDPQGDFYIYRHLHLRVTRGTRILLDKDVCDSNCGPDRGQTIAFRNLWGSRAPEIVVSLYTGGAHCCFENEFVLSKPDGQTVGIFHDWGDLGYRGQWHDGRYWFVTGDDRFAYAYTSFAGSAFPMQVWSIDAAGRLVDVTRHRLDLVAANAKRLWKAYLEDRARNDIRGVIAPWCADEYLLGEQSTCNAALSDALKHGWLRADDLGPGGRAYISKVHRDLAHWGYTRA